MNCIAIAYAVISLLLLSDFAYLTFKVTSKKKGLLLPQLNALALPTAFNAKVIYHRSSGWSKKDLFILLFKDNS